MFARVSSSVIRRCFTEVSSGERNLVDVLKQRFPEAAEIGVKDISGGCGSMFEVRVVAGDFKGKSRVEQHRAITDALKSEIMDNMHGLRISTDVPK